MNANRLNPSEQTQQSDFDLLLLAVNASKSGIIITDNQQPDNPIIFCNEAFEKMTGYNRSEIIGRNCRFLQGSDRKQEARFKLREVIDKGEGCIVELRNYRKNGSLFWNELYMSPIEIVEGRVTHFIGVQNDISERKKIEATLVMEREQLEKRVTERTRHLQDSEEYLKSIFETIRESLVVLDEKINVIEANQQFFRTFHVGMDDTLGKSLYELGNGQWNIPALKDLLERVLPTNNPFEGFQVEQDFPSIGKKNMVLNARRIETEGPFKNRILLAIQDETDRLQTEIRKDDFLKIASHELRTPLTTIKGYVQLMELQLSENKPDKLKELIGKSTASIEKLNRLITDLLDVSKIQAGKVSLNKSLFDFDSMVKGCIENVQAGKPTHTIHLRGERGIMYYGDESRIEQVFVNLLQNAIKYSPGAKEVNVYVSRVSDFVKVAVTDYGVGIRQEDHKKIFERFYRVESIQKMFPGIGIGLYVSEQIIHEHGGTLWVESEEGKGSTFSFTLPVVDEEA
jgi:PAS domain S-box-containing protein